MLAALSEKDYWSVINEQKLFEKALKQKDLSGGEPTTPVVEAGKTSKKAKPAVHNQEENQMSGNQPEISVEDAVALKKALEDQKVELQKALEAVELFKAKEKASIEKAREDEVKAALKEDEASAKLFKAVKELSDEAFKDVVDVVKSLSAKLDETDMFKEKGSPNSGVTVQKSADPVANALVARLSKQQ